MGPLEGGPALSVMDEAEKEEGWMWRDARSYAWLWVENAHVFV